MSNESENIVGLAPHKVYSFEFDWKALESPVRKYFIWYGDDSCSSTFVCPDLNGNVWADFGISVSTGESYQRVAQDGIVYQHDLAYNEILNVSYWRRPIHVLDDKDLEFFNSFHCYLWCSETGRPGDFDHIKPVDPGLSESLVSEKVCLVTFFNLYNIVGQVNGDRDVRPANLEANDELSVSFVAPVTIYRISGSNENWSSRIATSDSEEQQRSDCDEFGKCRKSLSLGWLWPDQHCEARFACLELEGNACGNFGLQVKFPNSDQEVSVCRPDFQFEGRMKFEEKTDFALWHANNSRFEFDCYFWCTIDGNLPRVKPTSHVDDDIILSIVSETQLILNVFNIH